MRAGRGVVSRSCPGRGTTIPGTNTRRLAPAFSSRMSENS